MSAALDLNTTRQSLNLPVNPVAQAQEIASALRAEAPKIEALGRLTPTVVDALHAHGLYRTLLPKQLNGHGAGLETFVKVMETLAEYVDFSGLGSRAIAEIRPTAAVPAPPSNQAASTQAPAPSLFPADEDFDDLLDDKADEHDIDLDDNILDPDDDDHLPDDDF